MFRIAKNTVKFVALYYVTVKATEGWVLIGSDVRKKLNRKSLTK